MRLAIIGSRTFNDYMLAKSWYESFFVSANVTSIVSGGAAGADKIGERISTEFLGKDAIIFLPDWDLHGKAAGFIRNKSIVVNSDIILAFWDGISKGTKHSINLAKRHHKPTFIVYV